MKSPSIRIPVSLINGLSTRAQRILARESIRSCEALLGFGTDNLRGLKNCGEKTLYQLERLQEEILGQYPELSHCLKRPQIQPVQIQPVQIQQPEPENLPNLPAEWSILNRSLPDLFQLAAPSSRQATNPESTVASLAIPADDLKRLRAGAIYPEDPVELLATLSLGYLIDAHLTDDTLTVIFEAILQHCGLAGLSAASLASGQVPDIALYPETASEPWEALRIPNFCDPALSEGNNRDGSAATWRSVTKLTERVVLERSGFSVAALRAIRHLWHLKALALELQKGAAAGLPPKVYGEFHQMADAYLWQAVSALSRQQAVATPERDYRVLRARLGLVDGRKCTLEQVGRQEKLTKERVRQIEAKLLAICRQPQSLQRLGYLWLWLDGLLSAGGGALYASDLAASLVDALGWTKRPSEEALALFIALSPNYRMIWDEPIGVVMTSHGCVNCVGIRSAVSRALADDLEGERAFDQAREAMREFCQGQRCRGIDTVTRFSEGLIRYLADATENLPRGKTHLYHEAVYRHKKAKSFRVLEHILRKAGKALHFNEVQRQVIRIMPEKPLSQYRICKTLSDSPLFLSWGRGTFILRELVALPALLMHEIQQDILATLDSHDIFYVCLNGFYFEKYQSRLLAENIPSPSALYSCLRSVKSTALSFVGYPYFTNARTSVTRA